MTDDLEAKARCIWEENGYRCMRAGGHEGRHRINLKEKPLPEGEWSSFPAWCEVRPGHWSLLTVRALAGRKEET